MSGPWWASVEVVDVSGVLGQRKACLQSRAMAWQALVPHLKGAVSRPAELTFCVS